MKTLIFIATLLTALACQQSKQRTKDAEAPSLAINDLKYSAYSWYYPSGKWEFYLDYFVHIDKMGHFKLMLRDSLMSKPKYYEGFINDTIRNIIDKTFAVDSFKTDYKHPQLQNIVYDGFTYCIDVKKDTSSKKIVFIGYRSPADLKRLSSLLDNIVNTTNATYVDRIDMSDYYKELERFSSTSLGPPPQHVAPKEWKPVKISR
jgi:hypothetical protein